MYTLPDLPYGYSALEPYISGKVMELHHSKHHKAYVDGANQALEQLCEARDKGDFSRVPQLQKNLAFNLAGHKNHSVFWSVLTPEVGQAPAGLFLEVIERDFGSFDSFMNHFSAAALSIQGSGWAVLSWEPVASRLIIQQFYDHQNNAVSARNLLLLDMWEHAYYLDYLNVKADYVKAFWSIVNWHGVTDKFLKIAGRSVV